MSSGTMKATEMFSPAKDKGRNVLQIYGGHVSNFYDGIRESKDAACPANMLFHSQRKAGIGLEHIKRFKRSSWKGSNLWEPGSQARKMGLAPCLQGAHSWGGGSKDVVCVF